MSHGQEDGLVAHELGRTFQEDSDRESGYSDDERRLRGIVGKATLTANITMTVVAPASLNISKLTEIGYPTGTMGAGMTLNFTMLPLTVSFGNTELLEVPGPATAKWGYFASGKGAGAHDHHPNS